MQRCSHSRLHAASAQLTTCSCLQGCNEQCLQQHLQQAIQLLAGAHYMPQAGKALAGQVAFADSTTLALSSQAAKLWAMELAALYGSTQAISGSDSSSVQVRVRTVVNSGCGIAANWAAALLCHGMMASDAMPPWSSRTSSNPCTAGS